MKSNYCYISILFLLLILGSSYSGKAQQTQLVDFKRVDALVQPIHSEKKVIGNMTYSFRILKDCDSIFLDAKKMKLLNHSQNKLIKLEANDTKIWLYSSFKTNQEYSVSFSYEAHPKQAMYFTDHQIWTQGQGKYTSNWLPSLDDMNDKIIFNLKVMAPVNQTVIANGKLEAVVQADSLQQWNFSMQQPMSSYLVGLAIGDFKNGESQSNTGIPIELYLENKDWNYFEPTYRYTKDIFDFLEKTIGFTYPWQNYKQVPVHDFLYAGMENTTATFFSEAFVVDSIGFTDRNYLNVNAHELAHQWFGNLVTETESTHHWLHEGFATYFAHLTEKEIFGEDYFYWKMYQAAEQLRTLSEEGRGEVLVNGKASSLTFYEKGAWALHILRETVGDEVFFNALKKYLVIYQFKNVTTDNFMDIVEEEYGSSLDEFKKDWLYQSAFKTEQAYQSLVKSSFMKDLFEITALRATSLTSKKKELEKELVLPNDFIGQEVIYQLEGEPIALTESLYKKAFASNNMYVRQAIALTLPKVPLELKAEYETLLDDASYATQEAAMGNLWVSFPEDKSKYLDIMDGVYGFKDNNIRQFWLFLALLTENYREADKVKYTKELIQYSSADYGHHVRDIALDYISYLQLWNKSALLNIIDAGQHHYWRFRNHSRELLKSLLENDSYRETIILLKKDLDETSSAFLDRMLAEE